MTRSADFHANNFSGSLVSQNNKLMGGYVRVADTTIFQSYPYVCWHSHYFNHPCATSAIVCTLCY